ncbi:MAG: M28 family peptidase [Candidatus Omnitrophica bacterium]|nr:M28 family peptidase [Candidatus Omnitrophota bacterium]
MSLISPLAIGAGASELSLKDRLKKHVVELSDTIGERNYWFYQNLNKAAKYIESEFKEFGYEVELHSYTLDNKEFSNIIAVKKGKSKPDEIIIVGAHYDSVVGSPGADDNASAVAGLLELACLFSKQEVDKTIKFIAFVNEEPPHFQSGSMGSRIYAKRAKKNKDNIVAMIALEMIGYYDKKEKTQDYPLFLGLFYPDTANFISFVSNFGSASLLNKLKKAFKEHSNFPLETITAPSIVPGIDWSDHSSFWKYGYKAIMVTDTSFYRYPHYHCQTDTYEKLDYESMAEVVRGLYYAIGEL